MSVGVHDKIDKFLKKQAVGNLSSVVCRLRYDGFIPRASLNSDSILEKFSIELSNLIAMGQHPTLNPIMDSLLSYDKGTLAKDIQAHIKKNCTFESFECDDKNDVAIIRTEIHLVTSNITPFLKQEKVIIESAEFQTFLFKYEIRD